MTATINGILVTGTPAEIAELMRIMYPTPTYVGPSTGGPWPYIPPVTSLQIGDNPNKTWTTTC